jgi:hypothetical protein
MSDHSAVQPVSVFQRYRKAVAAGLGALTPGPLVGILALIGVHMDAVTAGTIIGVLSPLVALVATAKAKANATDASPSV